MDKRGFSLLEVLIAVSIIGLVFVAFIKLNIINLISADHSITLTRLLFLTRQKVSELEIADYPEVGIKQGEFELYPGYRWIEKVSDFGVDGVRKIEIRVEAPDGQSNSIIIYKAR